MLSLWLTNLYDLWILTHENTPWWITKKIVKYERREKRTRQSRGYQRKRPRFEAREQRSMVLRSVVLDPHSTLSIQTARQNEQNWHESRATRKRDRASPLSERKGGQLAVTRRTCLTNYPAQLQRRYTLLRNRIHKRCNSNVAPPRVVELPEDSHFIFFFSLFFYFVLICFCLSLLGFKRT